jgi:hypothetical protein
LFPARRRSLLNNQRRFVDVEPFARRGCEILAFSPQDAYRRFVEGQLDVVRSACGQGKNAEAEMIFTCLLKSLRSNPPPDLTAKTLACYAEHLRRNHRDAEVDQLEECLRHMSAPNRNANLDYGRKAAPVAEKQPDTRKN